MYIFLDIDGVLNQLQQWYIDENCVNVLSKICKYYNAKIVLISSWRFGYFHNINNCSPQVVSLINKLNKFGLSIFSRTSKLGDRQKEINDFVTKYSIQSFIILDDDLSLYKDVRNLYIVNSKTGLTNKDFSKIIKRFR